MPVIGMSVSGPEPLPLAPSPPARAAGEREGTILSASPTNTAMRGLGILFAFISLGLALISCGPKQPDTQAQEESSKDASRAVAQKFGEAMMKKDWVAARALGTKAFQQEQTPEKLQAGFDKLASQLIQEEPGFKFNAIEIDNGSLPSSTKEAEQIYGIPNAPDIKTWRGWDFAVVGEGEKPTSVDKGMEARLLIVEEEGQLRVAHVEFSFPH